jgi:hypothetical protein
MKIPENDNEVEADEYVIEYERRGDSKFIIPRLQIKIIINVVFAAVGIIIISYFILIDYIKGHQLQDLLESSNLGEFEINQILNSLKYTLGYWAAISALYTIMLISFSIRLSHKIAGPVTHIIRVLGEYLDGNSKSRISLRKGDELVILEDLINRLLVSDEKAHRQIAAQHKEKQKKTS